MKKLLILLFLFTVAVIISLTLVINEMRRTGKSSSLQNAGQSVPAIGPAAESTQAPPPPASTTEGNITLVITGPQDKITTAQDSITIQGKTVPGASVMINEYELVAGGDGSFTQTVALDDGENYFSVVAYTAKGDVAERQLMVTKNVSGY